MCVCLFVCYFVCVSQGNWVFLDRPCSETGVFDGVVRFAWSRGVGSSGGSWPLGRTEGAYEELYEVSRRFAIQTKP